MLYSGIWCLRAYSHSRLRKKISHIRHLGKIGGLYTKTSIQGIIRISAKEQITTPLCVDDTMKLWNSFILSPKQKAMTLDLARLNQAVMGLIS